MNNAKQYQNAEQTDRIESLYQQFYPAMYKTALGILRNSEDAEDAVQNSFVQILRNWDKFQNISEEQTKNLVLKILRNKAIDIYRRKSKRNSSPSEFLLWYVPEFQSASALMHCISTLSETQRTALTLKYIHGYSNKEAACLLKIPEETFRKRAFRAKTVLEDVCKKEGLL